MNDLSTNKRPSLREAARRGVLAKQTAQATPTPATTSAAPNPPAPPAAKKPAPPQRPKPPVVAVEQVVVQCGHTVPFEVFDDRKDRYRDARLKKLTDKPCRDCRVKAHEERARAEQEASRRLRETQKPPSPKGGGARVVPRLPDGSRFDMLWDAAKGEWSGTLTIPGLAPFTASASGVFRLLPLLDGLYRATLPPEATPEATA